MTTSGPPPLPPPLPATGEREEPNWSLWVGLLVASIALLLIVLAFAFFPDPQPDVSQGADTTGTATASGDEDVETSGADSDSPASAKGESSPTRRDFDPSDANEGDKIAEIPVASNPVTRTGTVDGESEEKLKPVFRESGQTENSSAQTAPALPKQPESRLRTLNVGDGFVPLVAGEGNPLRVGEETQSVVYVIDKSSSMSGKRFHQVSTALVDAIDGLRPEQDFAVILFDNKSHPLDQLRLKPASQRQKQTTKQNLSKVWADGGTSPFEAVKDALDLKPEVVVLLSDGEFSQFDVTQITQYNRSRRPRTTIHCVGLQKNIRTLEILAKSNGNGAYTTVQLLASP